MTAIKQRNVAINLLTRYRQEIGWIFVFSLITSVLTLAPTLYMMQIYDRILVSQSDITLVVLSLVTLGFFLLMMYADLIRSKVMIVLGNKIEVSLTDQLFESSLQSFLQDKARDPSTYLRYLVEIKQFIAGMAIIHFFDMVWMPIYVLIAFLLHPILGLICLVMIVIQAALLVFNHYASVAVTNKSLETERETKTFLNLNLRNLLPIYAMGFVGAFKQRWLAYSNQSFDEIQTVGTRTKWIQSVNKYYRYIVQTVSLGAGAYLVIQGQISAGSMLAANVITARSILPLDQMTNIWPQWIAFLKANQHLSDLFQSTSNERSNVLEKLDKLELVECDNVSFSYPQQSSPALDGVSLTLKAGEVVAVIGKSGSGKSTLVKALLGIYPLSQGRVLYNNIPIQDLAMQQLGEQLGYLPQDFQLFEGTIAENIARFGMLDSEAITQAAIAAGIHEWVLRLPKAYDTLIGNNGQILSGGQKQQLGIARAIYKSTQLVVLDEPNSNLDELGERALFKTITDLKAKHAITIVVTHRDNVLQFVDKIIAMENGKILTFGAKEEVFGAPATPATNSNKM